MKDRIERAFHTLKRYCKKKVNCKKCKFEKEGNCVLFEAIPADWEIPGAKKVEG